MFHLDEKSATHRLQLLLVCFCVAMAAYNLFCSTPYYVFLSLLGVVVALVPAILGQMIGLPKDGPVQRTALLYVLFVYVIGMIFNGYSRIPLYDKLMHTVTGVLFGLCGLIVFYLLKPKEQGGMKVEKGEFWQAALFAAGMAAMIAIGWEIVEYCIDLVLHNDPQHVLDTGVNDTMWDMIVCMAGAVLFWIPMRRYYTTGKTGILMGVFESFRQSNLHREQEQ